MKQFPAVGNSVAFGSTPDAVARRHVPRFNGACPNLPAAAPMPDKGWRRHFEEPIPLPDEMAAKAAQGYYHDYARMANDTQLEADATESYACGQSGALAL